MSTFEKGNIVQFTGFTGGDDEQPENATLLTEGESYEIRDISDEDGSDVSYFLAAPNPDFNDKKRESKKANPKFKLVDVFADEIAEMEATTDETEEVAEVEATTSEEVTDEVADEEATVEAAPKKKTTKKKVSKKVSKKAAAAAKAKEDLVVAYTPDGDIELTDEMQSDDVMALIEGKNASQMIEVAQDHAKAAMLTDWVLGGILYNVKVSGSYKQVQDGTYDRKGGWESFVDEQIGLDYRKGQYLIDIYSKFTRFGVSKEVAARLSWSKSSRISSVMTQENSEDLVELASNSSFKDLDASVKEIRSTKGATSGTVIRKLGFRFRVAEEGGVILNDYLEQARKELGLDSLDDAFQHIVTEWSQEHLNLKKRTKGKSRSAATAAKTAEVEQNATA